VPSKKFRGYASEDSDDELGFPIDIDTYENDFINMCMSNKFKDEQQLFGYQSKHKLQVAEVNAYAASVRLLANDRPFDSLAYLGLLHYISVMGIFMQGKPIDNITYNLLALGATENLSDADGNRVRSVMVDRYNDRQIMTSFGLLGDEENFSKILKLRSMSSSFFKIMRYILKTGKSLTWILDANLTDYLNFQASSFLDKITLGGWREIYDEESDEDLYI